MILRAARQCSRTRRGRRWSSLCSACFLCSLNMDVHHLQSLRYCLPQSVSDSGLFYTHNNSARLVGRVCLSVCLGVRVCCVCVHVRVLLVKVVLLKVLWMDDSTLIMNRALSWLMCVHLWSESESPSQKVHYISLCLWWISRWYFHVCVTEVIHRPNRCV